MATPNSDATSDLVNRADGNADTVIRFLADAVWRFRRIAMFLPKSAQKRIPRHTRVAASNPPTNDTTDNLITHNVFNGFPPEREPLRSEKIVHVATSAVVFQIATTRARFIHWTTLTRRDCETDHHSTFARMGRKRCFSGHLAAVLFDQGKDHVPSRPTSGIRKCHISWRSAFSRRILSRIWYPTCAPLLISFEISS